MRALVEEADVAGLPAVVGRPRARRGPRPAIVFLNAAGHTSQAPYVRPFAARLARLGFLTVIPDLPGLGAGEISTKTLAAAVDAARETAARPDVRADRVAVAGVSTGGALALLAAAEAPLAGRVSVVAAIAPFADLRTGVRIGTTGSCPDLLRRSVARSLRAAAPAGSAAVDAALANRDPARFDELYEALPAEVLDAARRLSPLEAIERLRVPVELAFAPDDPFFPLAEGFALARACPSARLTVTRSLDHVRPAFGRGSLADDAALAGFLWRFLRTASVRERRALALAPVWGAS